ncbi:GntR family transcriptional regulator [Sinosporangium siamense]|uniref:Methycitrate-responsive transcriptional regulator of methylisocitrate utilization PrpR n=1 Tax=Sinosporangium siamense TaxID=1367973 RepID=A0A919RQ80_9ACTN|nr:GntR family transcriptional regulator [Sinosporangium siamense]GII97025.1 methycitrate-responsive transcriptional regulator of methylisocitrate utilization PrpR [Sinosporangium siamense]
MTVERLTKSAGLREGVYADLRRRILLCELLPGQTLDIGELSVEYGTSRTPVRDALHRLAHDDLVEILPRSQCRVAPVTLQDLIDLLNLREATGPMACRLAAQAAPAELARLADETELGYGGAHDSSSVLSASHLFHCTVARLSGNKRLHTITENLFEELERILRLCSARPLEPGEPLDDHRRLIEALQDRDGKRAADIELRHIRKAREVIIRLALDSGVFAGERLHA